MIFPFDPFSPVTRVFNEWRRYVALAHEGGPNADIFCQMAASYQMWYVIWGALERAKEKSQ